MMEEAIGATIPLGRMGTKLDIAHSATFLVSEAASYITFVLTSLSLCDRTEMLMRRCSRGETLVVDGAAWMWKPSAVPREMVADLARSIESKSRSSGGANPTPTSTPTPKL